jgi:hypothetical protein
MFLTKEQKNWTVHLLIYSVMRIAKLALISIIAFFLILTAIGALFPSVILVSRAVNIDRPADSITGYINDFAKWNEWMEGAKTDDLKVFVKDSTHAVFGTTVITLQSKQNNTWRYEWKQGGATQISTIHVTPKPAGCMVQWEYEQHLAWYPWAKLASMMNDKIIEAALEKNLANLKQIAER